MKGAVLVFFMVFESRNLCPGNKEGELMPANRPPLSREYSTRSMTTLQPDDSSDDEEEISRSLDEEQPGMAPVNLDIQERNAEPEKSFWRKLVDMCTCSGRRR